MSITLVAASLVHAPSAAGASPRSGGQTAAQKNQTKGQGQLAGASGQFGTIYSLQNQFNFAILGARYTLEPFVAYAPVAANTTSKVVVLDLSFKNVSKSDNFLNPEGLITLVDEKGQLYPMGSLALKSKAETEASFNLKPGQGLGQVELKDPLQIGAMIPGKVRIVKIIVNQGRLANKAEKVLRFYVAGATKEEAGEVGNPKNVISPLPMEVRDPADKSGAVALDEGKGTIGTFVPSGSFGLRLDSLAFSTEMVNGNPPDEGKRFAVATVTAKNLSHVTLSMFDITGGDSPMHEITDSDGEKGKPVAYRKAKRDEDAEHEFKAGDEYSFRIVFVVPKDATVKKLILGTGSSRKWAYDVSSVK